MTNSLHVMHFQHCYLFVQFIIFTSFHPRIKVGIIKITGGTIKLHLNCLFEYSLYPLAIQATGWWHARGCLYVLAMTYRELYRWTARTPHGWTPIPWLTTRHGATTDPIVNLTCQHAWSSWHNEAMSMLRIIQGRPSRIQVRVKSSQLVKFAFLPRDRKLNPIGDLTVRWSRSSSMSYILVWSGRITSLRTACWERVKLVF